MDVRRRKMPCDHAPLVFNLLHQHQDRRGCEGRTVGNRGGCPLFTHAAEPGRVDRWSRPRARSTVGPVVGAVEVLQRLPHVVERAAHDDQVVEVALRVLEVIRQDGIQLESEPVADLAGRRLRRGKGALGSDQ